MELIRVVSVPIFVSDKQKIKGEIGGAAARFANDLLSAHYLRAKKLQRPDVYTDYNDTLSSAVRDAINREALTTWQRFAKQILAGHSSLPLFSSDRSISVRDRGIKVSRVGESFVLHLTLLPKGVAERFEFPVKTITVKKDLWMNDRLSEFADGTVKPLKVGLVFLRSGKVFARIAYKKDIDDPVPGSAVLRIGPIGPNDELYTRVGSKVRSLTDRVQQLRKMKELIGNDVFQRRISKNKRAMKKNLRSFEEWSTTPLHQLSRSIVQFAVDEKCGKIEWRICEETVETHPVPMPWNRLRRYVEYKAGEHGIEIVKEKSLLDRPTKEDKKWQRQASKTLRQLGQATRKI